MKIKYNACDFNPDDLGIQNEDAFGFVESLIEAEIRKHFNDTQFVFVGVFLLKIHKKLCAKNTP